MAKYFQLPYPEQWPPGSVVGRSRYSPVTSPISCSPGASGEGCRLVPALPQPAAYDCWQGPRLLSLTNHPGQSRLRGGHVALG